MRGPLHGRFSRGTAAEEEQGGARMWKTGIGNLSTGTEGRRAGAAFFSSHPVVERTGAGPAPAAPRQSFCIARCSDGSVHEDNENFEKEEKEKWNIRV